MNVQDYMKMEIENQRFFQFFISTVSNKLWNTCIIGFNVQIKAATMLKDSVTNHVDFECFEPATCNRLTKIKEYGKREFSRRASLHKSSGLQLLYFFVCSVKLRIQKYYCLKDLLQCSC